jgi:hypothetical protein
MMQYKMSSRDFLLGMIFGISGLVLFGLSFSLFHADGRRYLFYSLLLLCMLCLIFADNRESRIGFVLGALAFIAIRLVWVIVAFGWH